jgi:hypothetical protein
MIKLILISLVSLIAVSSFANRQYGEAGCGLGSIVMGKDGNQILAATTNSSSYTNYFGITSGTSNCTDSGSVSAGKEIPMFIDVNKMALAKDAARGEGETLTGLAKLMGCDSKILGQSMKSNYNQIFLDTNMDSELIQQKISSQKCGV